MFAHRSATALTAFVTLAAASVPAAASTPPPDESDDFARMLSMVPATVADSEADVWYVDMTLAWDRLGVGSDPDERLDAIGQFGGADQYSFVPQLFLRRLRDVDEARAEVGFSTIDIDREIAVLAPPHGLYIDETSVPADDVVSALETDPTWSAELTEVTTDHGNYFTWGDDPLRQNLDRISPFRPFGRAGQLAVLGDDHATTVRTFDPADAEATLATIAGDGESAASRSPFAEIVGALEGEQVVQLLAFPRPLVLALPDLTPEVRERYVDDGLLLDPYLGIAIAEVVDGETLRTEILLVHLSEDDATANAEVVTEALADGIDLRTGQPLSELLPGAEVAVQGPVLRVAVDGPGHFARAYRLLIEQSLFPSA